MIDGGCFDSLGDPVGAAKEAYRLADVMEARMGGFRTAMGGGHVGLKYDLNVPTACALGNAPLILMSPVWIAEFIVDSIKAGEEDILAGPLGMLAHEFSHVNYDPFMPVNGEIGPAELGQEWNGALKHFSNVLEDARIESCMAEDSSRGKVYIRRMLAGLLKKAKDKGPQNYVDMYPVFAGRKLVPDEIKKPMGDAWAKTHGQAKRKEVDEIAVRYQELRDVMPNGSEREELVDLLKKYVDLLVEEDKDPPPSSCPSGEHREQQEKQEQQQQPSPPQQPPPSDQQKKDSEEGGEGEGSGESEEGESQDPDSKDGTESQEGDGDQTQEGDGQPGEDSGEGEEQEGGGSGDGRPDEHQEGGEEDGEGGGAEGDKDGEEEGEGGGAEGDGKGGEGESGEGDQDGTGAGEGQTGEGQEGGSQDSEGSSDGESGGKTSGNEAGTAEAAGEEDTQKESGGNRPEYKVDKKTREEIEKEIEKYDEETAAEYRASTDETDSGDTEAAERDPLADIEMPSPPPPRTEYEATTIDYDERSASRQNALIFDERKRQIERILRDKRNRHHSQRKGTFHTKSYMRSMTRSAHDDAKFFRQTQTAGKGHGDIDIVVGLDVSGSMEDEFWDLHEAAYNMKRIFGDMNMETSVILWSTRGGVLYGRGERVVGSVLREGNRGNGVMGGGTDPSAGSSIAYEILSKTARQKTLWLNMTDGGWAAEDTYVQKMKQELGTITSLILMGGSAHHLNPKDSMFAYYDKIEVADNMRRVAEVMVDVLEEVVASTAASR